MVKIISNEEYAKLTRDIDCWKALALKEENRKNFYENLYKSQKVKGIELIRENQSLDRKLEELENKNKLSSIYDRLIFQSNLKKIDKELEKEIYNEHYCNRNCFKEHILPSIQSDLNNFRYEKDSEEFDFLCYWDKKIKKEYDFVKYLHIYNGLIGVTFYSI